MMKQVKKFERFLFEFLLTYNRKDIHSAHGLTPVEARLDNECFSSSRNEKSQ